MNHTAYLGSSARLDIHDSTHGGTCTCNATEESGASVADTLADKFAVAVMLRLGDVVCYNRGEQRVYRAKTGKGETWYDRGLYDFPPVKSGNVNAFLGEEWHREPGRDMSDSKFLVKRTCNRDDGKDDECYERRRYLLCHIRESIDDSDGSETVQQRFRADAVSNHLWEVCYHVNNHDGRLETYQRIYLLKDDNHADTAHEAGKDRLRDVAHILADAYDTKEYLEQTAEDASHRHGDEYGAEIIGYVPGRTYQRGRDYGHRTCRATYLGVCTAKERGEKSKKGSTDETCESTHGGSAWVVNASECLYAKRQC